MSQKIVRNDLIQLGKKLNEFINRSLITKNELENFKISQ